MLRTIATLLVFTACVLTTSPVSSQDKPNKPADGFVHLSQGTIAVGIGYSWGGGTLSFGQKTYPLKIRGLSIGQAGISQAEASGEVFHLSKLEDFNGNYTAAGVEGTVAGGAGATALRNQNGVVIYLTSTTRGLNFKVAAEGVQISLAQPQ